MRWWLLQSTPAIAKRDSFLDLPLVPVDRVAGLYPPAAYRMFVAMSYARMNRVRAAKYSAGESARLRACQLREQPRAHFSTPHPQGDNCFILEDNTVQPFVRIGNNVTLWSGNHIGHDSTIDDHCFISSHVVMLGSRSDRAGCFIGVNATLRNSITIAEFTLIGAGALVTKNTEPRSVYLGARSERSSRTSDDVDL